MVLRGGAREVGTRGRRAGGQRERVVPYGKGAYSRRGRSALGGTGPRQGECHKRGKGPAGQGPGAAGEGEGGQHPLDITVCNVEDMPGQH